MKKTWLLAGSLILSSLLIGAGVMFEPAHANQQQWPGVALAIVNVNKVFKSYTKFTRLMDQLKGDIEAKENELRATEKIITGKMASLKSLTQKQDRDNAEKEIAELKFTFEKDRRDLQQSFLQREAQIYSTVYKELTDLLALYCKDYNIHIVLRYRDEGDAENPQAVLQTLNRQVVYHHPNLDLTKVIIDGMNGSQSQQ